jgi:hypothetical protein
MRTAESDGDGRRNRTWEGRASLCRFEERPERRRDTISVILVDDVERELEISESILYDGEKPMGERGIVWREDCSDYIDITFLLPAFLYRCCYASTETAGPCTANPHDVILPYESYQLQIFPFWYELITFLVLFDLQMEQ